MDIVLTILYAMAMVAIGAVLGAYFTFMTLRDFVRRKIIDIIKGKR